MRAFRVERPNGARVRAGFTGRGGRRFSRRAKGYWYWLFYAQLSIDAEQLIRGSGIERVIASKCPIECMAHGPVVPPHEEKSKKGVGRPVDQPADAFANLGKLDRETE
jgi:hypothetical protein